MIALKSRDSTLLFIDDKNDETMTGGIAKADPAVSSVEVFGFLYWITTAVAYGEFYFNPCLLFTLPLRSDKS